MTCQPKPAIEPSASVTTASSPDLETAADGSNDTTDNDIMDNVKEKSKPAFDNPVANKSLFVPVNRVLLERAQLLRRLKRLIHRSVMYLAK